VSLLFAGLFSGFLLGVLVLEASLRGYDGSVYTQVRRVEPDSLDTLAACVLAAGAASSPAIRIRPQETCGNRNRFMRAEPVWADPTRESAIHGWPTYRR
jgi:hypothetical protein